MAWKEIGESELKEVGVMKFDKEVMYQVFRQLFDGMDKAFPAYEAQCMKDNLTLNQFRAMRVCEVLEKLDAMTPEQVAAIKVASREGAKVQGDFFDQLKKAMETYQAVQQSRQIVI